jgi:hypothetical protein
MSILRFSADGLTFEKNIVTFLSSGKRYNSKSGSLIIPIIEISAINRIDHSDESLISILLDNGTTIEVNVQFTTDIKKYQTTFTNFMEAWKSLFHSKPPDLLSLIKTNLEENKKLRDEFLKFKEESTSKFQTNTETADLLSLV